MKKLFFVFCALTLLSYGCNRDKNEGTDVDTNMQQEESSAVNRDTDRQNLETQSESYPTSPSEESETIE